MDTDPLLIVLNSEDLSLKQAAKFVKKFTDLHQKSDAFNLNISNRERSSQVSDFAIDNLQRLLRELQSDASISITEKKDKHDKKRKKSMNTDPIDTHATAATSLDSPEKKKKRKSKKSA